MGNPETITITQVQLELAFTEWERDFRAGKTMTTEESLKRPPEEVARESAAHMFQSLKALA